MGGEGTDPLFLGEGCLPIHLVLLAVLWYARCVSLDHVYRKQTHDTDIDS